MESLFNSAWFFPDRVGRGVILELVLVPGPKIRARISPALGQNLITNGKTFKFISS
jgi:hypothetical protein